MHAKSLTVSIKELSPLCWNADQNYACTYALYTKGQTFQKRGWAKKKRHYLLQEETLYAIESGAAVLVVGSPLSIQSCSIASVQVSKRYCARG